MNREELRRRLIEAKAVNDLDDEDPFVGIYFCDLCRILDIPDI